MSYCPSCGAENPQGAKFCSACGTPMPVAAMPGQETQVATPPPPPYAQPTYPPQPVYPPQQTYPPAPYAPPGYPPYPQYPQPYGYPSFQAPAEKTGLPLAAGVLLIVAGVLGLVNWVWLFAFGAFVSFLPFPGVAEILLVCGIIGITFCVFALLGGVMAVQRKMWGLALVGSILGLFTIGYVGISSLLSLVALILIAISHREFT